MRNGKLSKLQAARRGLMHDLLTGRVRVPTQRAQSVDTALEPDTLEVTEPTSA